jgi:hypothetical protein
VLTAPPTRWAITVSTLDARVRTSSGTFSSSNGPEARVENREVSDAPARVGQRRSGQTSSSSSTKGSVTSIGLAINPSANETRTAT